MARENKRQHRPLRIGFYLFGALVVIGAMFSLYQLIGALITALLISFLIAPIANFAENRGMNRIVVVVMIYLIIAGVLLTGILFIGPVVTSELGKLAQDLPEYERQFESLLTNIGDSMSERMPALNIPDLYPLLKAQLFRGDGIELSSILTRLSGFFSLLMILVIIPVITFFFVVDGQVIQKSLLRIVPNRYFEMCVLLVNRTGIALQSFIRGQLIDALYVGTMTTIGMAIIGLPYFFAIGIFAGLGNLIPYLGPVIGFIPAFFIAVLTPGWFTVGNVLLIAGIFLVVQLTESAFIYPLAIGKSVNLHPLIVILGIIIGGRFGGILGMLVAVPIISIVKVILETVSTYLKSYRII